MVAPEGVVSVKDRDLELDGNFLLNLSDAVRGTITISVESEGLVIAEDTRPVELLAYNEWGGAGYMPELLAAFSMPNDPAIDRVLRDASLILRKAGKSDGIDGYKSRSRERVWEVATAIYTAIANLGISYAVPPASFEQDGQKIRLPSQVLENRVATCLDSTMLFAASLEQAGLNPVVVMPDPSQDAQTLTRLKDEGEAIDRLDKLLSGFKDWDGHTTEPSAALALHDLGQRARVIVGKLADDAQGLAELRGKVRTLMYDGNDLLAPEAAVGRIAQSLGEAIGNFQSACDSFEAIAGRSVREHFSKSEKALDVIRETSDSIASRHAELHDWCGWRRRRTEAMDMELGPLVNAIEGGDVPIDEIGLTFEAAYCTWWSGALIGEDEVLRTFSTPEHSAAIQKFRKIDSHFQELTASYIAAKLTGKLPGAEGVAKKSSWGVLRRELQKKSRHKPIRQLIEEIPEVLTTLAPCLMMSPLSVAQYLPAEQALFDVVIFDEASQITVWDAVGALARGHQAIIAGDPKQMPPTNFFARADDDPDGDVDIEGDLESILDEMLGASIPQRTLNLHYRSRKESLIAFSNARYYDNELVTFPAPLHPDNGVKLVRPEGFYARGKARHNEGEAKAIVSEIYRRLTHKDQSVRELSIGVVTFNSEQQSLIENLLDEMRSKDSEIEWAFSTDNVLETVFVKNLETVQGDERDVILFSITYGPDQSDHVTMNFGPLNREGGERRLNVAMTRARSEMLVFSTLSPDRIDLSRTSSRAVADLKHFLEYAERGPTALGSAVFGSIGDFESPFEVAVARGLRDRGWDVHPQIGVSAYRIDLGVVHPDMPGVYLAGVECDGAMYHSSANARERDKIRQSVLEGLGWTLFRVWSTDWWTHRDQALETLHQSLQTRLETDRLEREKAVQAEAAEESVSSSLPDIVGENSEEGKDIDLVAARQVIDQGQSHPSLEPNLQSSEAKAILQDEQSSFPLPNLNLGIVGDLFGNLESSYVMTQFVGASFHPDPNAFYTPEYEARLSVMINHVIDTEGPIHEDVLVRRIARHHGFQRAGRQINEVVIKLAKRFRRQAAESVGLFFLRKRAGNEHVAPARYNGRNDEMKKVEYISSEELIAINAEQNLENDPVQLARCLGIARLRQSARKRIDDVFSQLGSDGEQ
jgi:very-short-patch-repair endonuclease